MNENRLNNLLKERYRPPRSHAIECGNPEYFLLPEREAKIKAFVGEEFSCVGKWWAENEAAINYGQYMTTVPYVAPANDVRIDELKSDVESLRNELSDTAATLSDVTKRIAFLEARTSGWLHRADYFEASAALEQVKRITIEVFGAEFRVNEKEDFETAGDRFFEIRIKTSGTVEEIVARNDLWHCRIAALGPHVSGLFRLSIDVDEQ